MNVLRDKGFNIIAIAPYDEFSVKIKEAGFVYHEVNINGGGTNPLEEIKSIYKFSKAFRLHKVDLVLSFTHKANLYSIFAGIFSNSPCLPNISGLGRAFIKKNWLSIVVRLLYKITLSRVPQVFFQNLDDRNVFQQLALLKKDQAVNVPGSGIDLIKFNSKQYFPRSVEATQFTLIGRMLWDKGVGEFVEAAKIVKQNYPYTKFILIGSSDYDNASAIALATLKDWEAKGIIEYLGPLSNVIPQIEASDVVVLPSYREGLPRSLLEACAIGRPLIATNVPGCKDLVIDGITGFLCKPKDAKDLAKSMVRFLNLSHEEKQEMGLNARKLAEEKFDHNIVINKYLETIQELTQR
jgi:glycosyltransferase involved in cell wall biosynthesis